MQILENIFTDRMNEDKLDELSERQIDLVNFYYEKGYHFEMMHGIINGCYEKIYDLYAENLLNDFRLIMNNFENRINMYLLQVSFLKSANESDNDEMFEICMKTFTKKQSGEIKHLHKKLVSMMRFVDVEDNQTDMLFNQFIDAENYVESLKSS